MGEYMIMNPRRRRRAGKKRASAKRRRSGKKRATKRRSTSRRAANRRRRSSGRRAMGGLRLPNIAGLNMGSAVAGAIGVVAAEQLTVMASTYVPVDALKSGPGRIALKIGVAAAATMLAKRFAGKALAAQLATGMGISVALDAYKLVAVGVPGLPQLGEVGEIVPSLGYIGASDSDDETVGGLGALAEPAFATSW